MGGSRLFRLQTQTRLGVSSRSNGIQQYLSKAFHSGSHFPFQPSICAIPSNESSGTTRHLLLAKKSIPSSVSEPLSPICTMKTFEWVAHAVRSLASHTHGCSCQYNSPK